jgi:hypothetical protein
MQLTPPGTPFLQVAGGADEISPANADDTPIATAKAAVAQLDRLECIFLILP